MKILSVEYDNIQYSGMFQRHGYEVESTSNPGVVDVTKYDAILFTGGEDVSPKLYDEPNLYSYTDYTRDRAEKQLWERAVEAGVPCLGICRGSQFLTVMNGGKLVQDVKGHAIRGSHKMYTVDDREIMVSSTHHQMMIPGGNHLLIGWGIHGKDKKNGWGQKIHQELDPEVVFYPNTNNLAVQYHPEIMDNEAPAVDYYFELLKEYIHE